VLAAGHYVVSKPYLIFLVLAGNPNLVSGGGWQKKQGFVAPGSTTKFSELQFVVFLHRDFAALKSLQKSLLPTF
jgi:hypothetical protein